MQGIIVTGCLVIGLGLVLVEVFFVPGTTIIGLLGLGTWGTGILLAFMYFDSNTGLWLLFGSSILCVSMIIYSFRARFWTKLSLQDEHKSHVRRSGETKRKTLYVGMQGLAHSDLRPVGQGIFAHEYFEVIAQSEYIGAQTPIEIICIDEQIYVKSLLTKHS